MAYTPERIAEVMAMLSANGGNLSETSRQSGVPFSTIKAWKDKKRGGANQESSSTFVLPKKEALADKLMLTAALCMKEFLRRLQEQPASISNADLLRAAGISVDKYINLQGLDYIERYKELEQRVVKAEQVAMLRAAGGIGGAA